MKRYLTAFIISVLVGISLLAVTILKLNPKQTFKPIITAAPDTVQSDSSISAPAAAAIYRIQFNTADSIKRLKQRKFSGKTTAQIKFIDGKNALHISGSNSSVLFYEEVDIEIPENAKLRVEWKPDHYPSNKKNDYLGSKPDNDFTCQIYLLFKSGPFISSSDVMQYLMDDQYYEGQNGTSDYSDKVKLMVIDSRVQNRESMEWKTVSRNIRKDYRQLFGRELKYRLGGIGIMSDSDNTNTVAAAYVRGIEILVPDDHQA